MLIPKAEIAIGMTLLHEQAHLSNERLKEAYQILEEAEIPVPFSYFEDRPLSRKTRALEYCRWIWGLLKINHSI